MTGTIDACRSARSRGIASWRGQEAAVARPNAEAQQAFLNTDWPLGSRAPWRSCWHTGDSDRLRRTRLRSLEILPVEGLMTA